MNAKLSMLAALLVAVVCLASPSHVLADQTQEVEQAANDFYKALNTLFTGDAEPMFELWSHADDVTYLGPAGGFQVGWDQVRANWQVQAERKLGGTIEPTDIHITIGDDLAFVQCYEVGANTTPEGKPIKVSIRATSIFRLEDGKWKMISHQTDPIPFLEKISKE